jgi:starch synthase
VKKIYDEDPVFRGTKVVLSLYDNGFDKPLDRNFHRKLSLDGVPPEDLKVIEEPSYINYCKLAINMSDGIILASNAIPGDIVRYAEKTGKPLLTYQPADTYVDAYSAFYDVVLNHSAS